MIHFFEGFYWPSNTTTPGGDRDMCEFDLPNTSISVPIAGGSIYTLLSNIRFRGVGKRNIPSRPKFVLGYRLAIPTAGTQASAQHGSTVLTPYNATVNPNTTVDTSVGTAPAGSTDRLPILQVNASGTYGIIGLSIRGAAWGASSIWQDALPGVDFGAPHFYEVVYDFANNRIEVWLDNFQVAGISYTFTDTQKTMNIRVIFDHQNQFTNSANAAQPRFYGMYAADERLGPVTFGYKKPTADAQVSPEFTDLPGWSKVSVRSDGAGAALAKITTTKSKQFALFSNSDIASGEILGISFRGRFSSLEQSAFEAYGSAKMTLRLNGQNVQSEPLDIPKQGFVKNIDVYDKSPFTGVAWTADEINNLLFGAEIVTNPKII